MSKSVFFKAVLPMVIIAGLVIWYLQHSIPDTGTVAPLTTSVPSEEADIAPADDSDPFPVSLPALMNKRYDGRGLTIGKVLEQNDSYTRYYITYNSGDLTISGVMNVPQGAGPFPILVLNHGYIDPATYSNGRGLKREQDYLARHGYVVIHPDYRNHAESSKDPEADLHLRLGYVEDVINLVEAVKSAHLSYMDVDKIGMLGHSMGGGVTLNTIVVKPDIVKAAALFAPISGDYRDNFTRWMAQSEVGPQILAEYGDPADTPGFWDNVSANNFLDRIKAPVLLVHGSADADVPVAWSDTLHRLLQEQGKKQEYKVYPGEPHEFITAWPEVMQTTVNFFDTILK